MYCTIQWPIHCEVLGKGLTIMRGVDVTMWGVEGCDGEGGVVPFNFDDYTVMDSHTYG